MRKLLWACVFACALGTYGLAGSPGLAYLDQLNVFTANQRINAGLGVNVAPGATGTISLSGALFPFGSTTSTTTLTTTGTINDLSFGNVSVIRMNNAATATIQGLVAGSDGQFVVIVSVGTGEVDLVNQASGDSTAANRLINFVTSGITPLAAGKGSATYQYDATTARWRLVAHEQGDWINVPFSAGNFGGTSAMTWTVASGNITTNRYWLRGTTLSWDLYITGTSVGGTPTSTLTAVIPNGYTTGTTAFDLAMLFGEDAGTRLTAFSVSENISSTQIGIVKQDGTVWTASSGTTQIAGINTIRIQ